MKWRSGDRFEGEWAEDSRNGKGRITYVFGPVAYYDDQWAGGKGNGDSSYFWPDGTVSRGIWVDGRYVGRGIRRRILPTIE